MDASEIYPRRINAKEVLMSQKGEDFIFPVADGTAKLSGREYEFREPTPRRERTARSEDVSGELQGEPGGPQPTESKDDAEARADFWSIQGDFICRHHSEPRVQLYVPKEEAFTYSTEIHRCYQVHSYWSGRHARKAYWWLLEYRFEQEFVRFLERIDQIHSIERRTSQRTNVVRGETDQSSNDYETRSCVAWSMEQNWESRSESRTTRKGKRETKTRQCSTTERNLLCWSGWRRTQGNSLNARIKLERPVDAAMPCKRRFNSSTRKLAAELNASHKVPKTKYGCIVESHESTRQRVEPSLPKNHKRPHYRQRIYFDDPLQFGSQIYSYATSDDNSGCRISSG